MRDKRYLIKYPNGRKLGFTPLLAIWLLLDKLEVSQLGWGIYYTLAGLVVVAYIIDLFRVEEITVDIQDFLKKENEEIEKKKDKEEREVHIENPFGKNMKNITKCQ